AQEVRRLAHVGPARLDPVVRTDWNVDVLPRVAVVVADEERAGAVRVVVPPFERAGDAVTGAATRLGNRDLLGRDNNAAGQEAGGAEEAESVHCCFSLSLVVFASLALRSA